MRKIDTAVIVLAVGKHTRRPRRYRGVDIVWWLEQIGALSRTIAQVRDRRMARRGPSILRGKAAVDQFDVSTLDKARVVIAGRLIHPEGHRVHFGHDLPTRLPTPRHGGCDAGRDRSLHRVRSPRGSGISKAASPSDKRDERNTRVGPARCRHSTVVLATGFPVPRLRVPVSHRHRDARQYRGITSPQAFMSLANGSCTGATQAPSTELATTPERSLITSGRRTCRVGPEYSCPQGCESCEPSDS
jgi:putative flavoprotein involved in K+ transport